MEAIQQKKNKSYQAVFEKSSFKWKVDDGQTTDESALEKIRCQRLAELKANNWSCIYRTAKCLP